MKRQITLRQYRTMDLILFTALLCVCETLITLGATRWFPGEPYVLSLTPAVTAIVMVRWGCFGAVPAVLGALVYGMASGAALSQLAIYAIGNLAALALLPLVTGEGWKRLHDQVLLALAYGVLTALLMQVGRGLMALAMGTDPLLCGGFITTDTLSTLFAALIVWIARRLDGMLEEQKHYLTRVAEEQERERQARGNDPWQ